ncbi:MAG TPA: hypothetical protein V6C58_16180 [Allocoleopsis sp.]
MDYIEEILEKIKEWLGKVIDSLLDPQPESEPVPIPIPVNDRSRYSH